MAQAGRPKNPPTPKKMLKEVLPVEHIFSEDEIELYNKLVDVYLDDFDTDDLTSSDMDDILDLAKNRVLEFRLLKENKGAANVIDTSQAIDKLSRKNKEIKENLSARRKDRINPNEFKGFSIVDLAVAFNNAKQEKLKQKAKSLKEEEKEILERRKSYNGNRYDADVKKIKTEDDQ